MLSFANFNKSCFCPISLKKIVAFTSGLFPSRLITFPKPKRSCSTSMPTCKLDVSEGAKPGEGTCALASIAVVLTTGALGFENASVCLLLLLLQAARSSSNNALPVLTGLAVKSSSRYRASISSKNRLGSQLISVPNLKREVA